MAGRFDGHGVAADPLVETSCITMSGRVCRTWYSSPTHRIDLSKARASIPLISEGLCSSALDGDRKGGGFSDGCQLGGEAAGTGLVIGGKCAYGSRRRGSLSLRPVA